MARRKKKRKERGTQDPPALTGIAALLSERPEAVLDLHGLTRGQAEGRLADFLRTHARVSAGRVVHVITGRGRGSEGMPVLPGLVRDLLMHDLDAFVVEWAGLPGSGGVAVRVAEE